jgi:hypothetical protein
MAWGMVRLWEKAWGKVRLWEKAWGKVRLWEKARGKKVRLEVWDKAYYSRAFPQGLFLNLSFTHMGKAYSQTFSLFLSLPQVYIIFRNVEIFPPQK